MKQHPQWIAAIASGVTVLAAVATAHGQGATGQDSLNNVTPGSVAAYYAAWGGAPTVTTGTATGLEISSAGYGSLYYANATPVALNSADTQATLTFTLNGPAGSAYVGLPFILNDNAGAITYGGYAAYNFPGTYSETVTLTPAQQAAVALGNDAIYGFNLEFDPAGNTAGNAYDITFNSLTLTAAPEPGTMALFALGATGLAALRRKK